MRLFLEYTTAKNKHYMLRPEQIRALESVGDGTRIYATVAGSPITFQVKAPYAEVSKELKQMVEEGFEASI